mmetsp:Transcript_104585/g.301536  ORF Transcript_104585/g.301536 Transcript_104585/m.301536 type:complete len:109 (-) Transcript_104585:606-932(-)
MIQPRSRSLPTLPSTDTLLTSRLPLHRLVPIPSPYWTNPQVKKKIKKWYEDRKYQAGMMTHDDFSKLLHDLQKTPENSYHASLLFKKIDRRNQRVVTQDDLRVFLVGS